MSLAYSSTTGSCASSSGASSSGRGSNRAARQHKVGAAAPAPLVTPSTNPQAVMAADQPEMPNNGLPGKKIIINHKTRQKKMVFRLIFFLACIILSVLSNFLLHSFSYFRRVSQFFFFVCSYFSICVLVKRFADETRSKFCI